MFLPGDRVLTFASHRTHFKIPSDDILVVLPEAADPKLACCTYLFHLGYDALQKAQVRLGSPVVVIGLGVLGLASVANCALAGAQVYAVGNQDKSRKLAEEFGARSVFRREELEELKATLGDRLADAVLTTSNMWSDWSIALQLAGMHGHISVLGFPGRQESDIPFNPLDSQYFYNKQLCVQSVGISPERTDSRGFLKFNERRNLQFLLEKINEDKLQPQKLISKVWPARELAQAYEALLDRINSPLTFVLQWKS